MKLPSLSDYDLDLLNLFKEVVDCGGLSSAQVKLGKSVSTISSKLSALEIRLGYTLCYRGRQGFALTSEGKTVYQQILSLQSALETFSHNVKNISNSFRCVEFYGLVFHSMNLSIRNLVLLKLSDVVKRPTPKSLTMSG